MTKLKKINLFLLGICLTSQLSSQNLIGFNSTFTYNDNAHIWNTVEFEFNMLTDDSCAFNIINNVYIGALVSSDTLKYSGTCEAKGSKIYLKNDLVNLTIKSKKHGKIFVNGYFINSKNKKIEINYYHYLSLES